MTAAAATLGAEEFVEHVLVRTLHAAAAVVAADFTCGRGDDDSLRRLTERYGFFAHEVGLLQATDSPRSSIHVSTCLRRPPRVDGTAGIPGTVTLPAGTALPGAGGHAGRVNRRPGLLEVAADRRLVMRSPRAGEPGVPGVAVEFLEKADTGLAGRP